MEIFDYDNVLLLPRKCRVESRSECNAGVELGGRTFRIPVVPANMKTVVDESICLWMARNGYFLTLKPILPCRPSSTCEHSWLARASVTTNHTNHTQLKLFLY